MSEEEAPGGYVRLLVAMDGEPGTGEQEEWVWAEPLGSSRFRIESTPFFAYGLSHGDVVRASERGEKAVLSEVERKSGHRTLRLALDGALEVQREEVQAFLEELLVLGCTYEAMPPKLVALDVPPELDVALVVERLQERSRAGELVWEWADPQPS